jgi:hypothetical protein
MTGVIGYAAFACVAVCTMANTAPATFVGICVDDITSNDDGLKEYAVYLCFDDPADGIIGVSKANVVSSTAFFHSLVNGEKSALPWTVAQNAISDNPDADSFVTVGLFTGDGNTTMLGPGFDEAAFLNGTTLGTDASWFAFNSAFAGPSGKILVAVLAPLNDASGNAGIVSGLIHFVYAKGGTTITVAEDTFTTVPAPAGGIMLLVAPFLMRRRRR